MVFRSFFVFLMIALSSLSANEPVSETIIAEQVDQNIETPTQNEMQPRRYRANPPEQNASEDLEKDYPETSLQNTSSFKRAFYKTLAILFGGIILVIVGVWFFKRYSRGSFQPGNSMKNIKVLEKRPISPKSMLYLIEVGGQKILISESQFEVRTISELEWLESTKQGL